VRFIRVESGPNAGLVEKVVFLDAAQQPQPTETGAYGYRNSMNVGWFTRVSHWDRGWRTGPITMVCSRV
jgi:hypothetical protein